MHLGPIPSLGLAYIAAVLRDAGHTVQVIDAVGEGLGRIRKIDSAVGELQRVGLSPEEIVARIEPETEIIGFTNMFIHEWPSLRETAELARLRFPTARTVIGGENATSFWPWMFEQTSAIDYAVLGEGEATAVELFGRLAGGEPVTHLPGVAVRGASEASDDGGLPTRMRKLAHLPRPAWDLFPLEKYWAIGDYHGVNRGTALPIMATRGCPYQCTFCTAPQMWTTRYVVREPDDVAAEIAGLVREHGISNVNFCDLTAITKAKWTLRFCDALEAEGLDISWQLPTGTRAEALNAEVLQRLADTGCRNVTYAPESGSARLLEIMQKRLKLPAILESIRHARRIGIVSRIWIITGHPEERWRDVLLTFKFLAQAAWAGCDDAGVHNYCVYPGSSDFKNFVEQGAITIDDEFYYSELVRNRWHLPSYNPRMSSGLIRVIIKLQLLFFYAIAVTRRPRRLYEIIRAQITGKSETYVDQILRSEAPWAPSIPDTVARMEEGQSIADHAVRT